MSRKNWCERYLYILDTERGTYVHRSLRSRLRSQGCCFKNIAWYALPGNPVLDLLWPSLLLVGAERVHIAPGITKVTPLDLEFHAIFHSLLAVVGWSVLFALVCQAIKRYPRAAVMLGLAVVSHWLLDLIVHRPDLPLVPGSNVKGGLRRLAFTSWNNVVYE